MSNPTLTVNGIDVRKLPAETEVSVDTSNSHYRFVMLDDGGSRALVHGGRYFGDEAEARIEGSTLHGALLRLGWIGLGLSLELSVQGKRIDTSRVRSITISTPALIDSSIGATTERRMTS
jgi:hypothetical protein